MPGSPITDCDRSACLAQDRDEQFVHPRVTSELRMERRRQQRPLPNGHDPIPRRAGKHEHVVATLLHPRSPDEHAMHRALRLAHTAELEVTLPRVDLTAEGVAPHGHVDAAYADLVGR